MSLFDVLAASLHHPLAGLEHQRSARKEYARGRAKAAPIPTIRGWFAPPAGTLALGVGRQPNGYTCGTETFLSICEFLQLPLNDPDDDTLAEYSKRLRTSAKYGTDPIDIQKTAEKFLRIEADIENPSSIERLAAITNGTMAYVDRLLAGGAIDKPLELAMVTYQAYLDRTHTHSNYYPGGYRRATRTRTGRRLPIRRGRRVLWENDWTDGHWSVVLRVIQPGASALAAISRRLDTPVHEGIVILGDPSNGEGLSFIPIPEFERRWHDTDRHDAPRFDKTAVVLRVPPTMLRRMRDKARQRRAPMFATIRRNAVMYLP